jgi:glutamate-1-semialdehyde 2,1-aminomutase
VRTGAAVGGPPFIASRGRGAYIYDTAGRAFVDYVMAYGPLLFGHAHPELVRGLDALAARGTVYGSTTEDEVRLAERIAGHVPAMEQLRFVSTGTEAMMSAVRVARAATGRSLIARFAGNYHGHFDGALHDAGASVQAGRAAAGHPADAKAAHSADARAARTADATAAHTTDAGAAGIPHSVRREVVVARYNDLADFDERLAGRANELAAIVVEPVAGNMGLVLAEPDFLDGLFARARRAGALVIFDEVITWLRLGLGGAAARTGHVPDLMAAGKAMGGGFALAAFGGRADVMRALSPEGSAFTGGTFSGNPFAVALGHRTLDLIERDPGMYARLESNGRLLAEGMREIFARRGVLYAVTQLGSMVDFAFRPGPPVRNYDERSQADTRAFAAYYHAMRARGILLAPSSNELMFLSTEHGPSEIVRTLEAIDAAFGNVSTSG